MKHNQPSKSNPQVDAERFVHIPLDIEHSPTTPINQPSTSNKTNIVKWRTIIICIIFIGTGQSIARLLEIFFYHNRNIRLFNHEDIWTQSLLQVVGFPLLIIPFFALLFLSSKKQNQPPITSDRTSLKYLAIIYPIIGIIMAVQARLTWSKFQIQFEIFTLVYTTQLLFTPIFSYVLNKMKFNWWIIISLVFAILTGAFSLKIYSVGYLFYFGRKMSYALTSSSFAALLFSLLLCNIKYTFDVVISKRNEATNRKPSFAAVLELLIFSSLFATVFLVAAVFISGEYNYLKREMYGFSKGDMAYVLTMVSQATAWQIYWVGIVGIVYGVSTVFSNVIIVCTWPIVSVLVALFYKRYKDYDVLIGITLATAALSVASYFYSIHKEKRRVDEATN